MVAADPEPPPLILLVDDDDPVRGLCRLALERGGYAVVDVKTPMDALSIVGAHGGEIALLITDLVMPGGMDGVALAQAARRLRPALPVLYITGFSRRAAGLEPLLRKPFSLRDLLDAVGRVLAAPGDRDRPA